MQPHILILNYIISNTNISSINPFHLSKIIDNCNRMLWSKSNFISIEKF